MSNELTTDPYAVAATALKQIIDGEFAAESIVAIHDNIHESLGEDRITVGIAPTREATLPNNTLVTAQVIEVRFYDLWDKEVDPEQSINPMRITGFANRLKRAIQQSRVSFNGGNEVWYFDWLTTEYPNDPTGNKTRFHMTVRGQGDNTALIETR